MCHPSGSAGSPRSSGASRRTPGIASTCRRHDWHRRARRQVGRFVTPRREGPGAAFVVPSGAEAQAEGTRAGGAPVDALLQPERPDGVTAQLVPVGRAEDLRKSVLEDRADIRCPWPAWTRRSVKTSPSSARARSTDSASEVAKNTWSSVQLVSEVRCVFMLPAWRLSREVADDQATEDGRREPTVHDRRARIAAPGPSSWGVAFAIVVRPPARGQLRREAGLHGTPRIRWPVYTSGLGDYTVGIHQ